MTGVRGGGERAGLPELGEVLGFLRLLWALDHALQTRSRRMAGRFGITGPQQLVLRLAGRFPGISAGQLAAILHVHPSTLTGVLKRLQRRGLLSRRPDPKDGRRATIALTVAGRRLDLAAAGALEVAVRQVLAGQPAAGIRATREVLRLLTDGLADPRGTR